MRAIIHLVVRMAIAAVLLAGSVSCGDVTRMGRAPVILVIDSIEGASGAAPDTFASFLLSDVETLIQTTVDGETVRVPTIFNDVGQATLRLVMKDQGTGGLGVSPSVLNSVTLHRYRIVFRRADGRNTPGIDVPHSFDGAITSTVTNTGTIVGFEIVRHQSKLEMPLRPLANDGGRVFISTIAEITFYGIDLSGNEVQATGTMSVSFSDYADPTAQE